MRMSELFGQTLREASLGRGGPHSHALLLRAAIHPPACPPVCSATYPWARRALTKIENIIRQEMDVIGRSGDDDAGRPPCGYLEGERALGQIDAEMGALQRPRWPRYGSGDDPTKRWSPDLCAGRCAPIASYRACSTTSRPSGAMTRARAPRLIRVREFTMKDSYSLDADWEGLDVQYRKHYQAYFNIFQRCGLPVIAGRKPT